MLFKRCAKNIFFSILNLIRSKKYRIKVDSVESNFIDDKLPRISIAFQVHCFYTDLLPELYDYLNVMSLKFDLFISTDTADKKKDIESFFQCKKIKACEKISVKVFDNRGRDIYPFLAQISPVWNKYDYIGHFHTKKSLTADFGDEWRNYIYKNIFANSIYVTNLFCYMQEHPRVGFVTPPPYKKILSMYYFNRMSKKNVQSINDLLQKLGIKIFSKKNVSLSFEFPAGNMFIAKRNSIKQIFEYGFSANDFPEEFGQVSNTLQHTIELIWHYLVFFNKYDYKECSL